MSLPLTEALRGIVIFPEDFQDVVAGDLGGSVGEEDGPPCDPSLPVHTSSYVGLGDTPPM